MSNPYDCFACHNEGYDHAPDCPYHPDNLADAGETMNDTWLDTWLDRHPRADRAYTRWHKLVWYRVRTVRGMLDLRERRAYAQWKVGVTYLDHGYEPCVLVEKDEYGGLTGASLVDGRLIGGCSMYHCGPEMVSLDEARRDAEAIRAERAVD